MEWIRGKEIGRGSLTIYTAKPTNPYSHLQPLVAVKVSTLIRSRTRSKSSTKSAPAHKSSAASAPITQSRTARSSTTWFLVLEYASGGTLADACQNLIRIRNTKFCSQESINMTVWDFILPALSAVFGISDTIVVVLTMALMSGMRHWISILSGFFNTKSVHILANFRDAHGRTGLHWASYFGSEETVITLLRLGAVASFPDLLARSNFTWILQSSVTRNWEITHIYIKFKLGNWRSQIPSFFQVEILNFYVYEFKQGN
ncbi:hypothetical protein DVH24_028815 [Malus domestica]|uniref:Uncharacterized protein n=1 Tax=Malus domestica TaxID=3750 RepID=A0A498IY74_MALDO|nr:hypothetical protein DVH24_028815 [Malus domestica]